jgi:hypothetical protein
MSARQAITVDAEAIAWAVVAAARTYGDDPERAITGTGRWDRRSLPAAITGLAQASGAQASVLADILKLPHGTVRSAQAHRKGRFDAAARAAADAARLVLEDDLQDGRGEAEAEAEAEAEPEAEPGSVEPPPAPEPAAAAPVYQGPRHAPPVNFRREAERVVGEMTLTDRILAALAKGPGTSRGLSVVLDAKELLVARCLSTLSHAGAIKAGPMPESGQRDQRWYLADRAPS